MDVKSQLEAGRETNICVSAAVGASRWTGTAAWELQGRLLNHTFLHKSISGNNVCLTQRGGASPSRIILIC